jgi:hypothetical protein
MTLDQHLTQCYAERVMHERTYRGAFDVLKTDIGSDPALKAEAEAKLAVLKQIPDQRCFISKTHRAILMDALNS